MKIVDRQTKQEYEMTYDNSVKFLYNNVLGRIILKFINNHLISKIVGTYMNSKLSLKRIDKTIKENNINMNLYEEKKYTCFNDFFTRKKKDLKFDKNKNHFVSPADAKLLVIKLDDKARFDIKRSIYTMKDIIDKDLSKKYQNGYALIFRLEITDYHRYHFIDNGYLEQYKYIKGKLHTVQPIAYQKYKVFHTNSREYTVLHTENFGDILDIDVGAMMVGKITNHKDKKKFVRGEEKGYFEFGGSTIILFVEDKKVILDNDLLLNSALGKETIVKVGEKIGIKYK